MMIARGIDHINITVRSVEKAKTFYTKFFGFKVFEDYKYINDEGEKIRFTLIGEPQKLMLCLYESLTNKSSPALTMLSHLGINVENFEESLKIAEKNNLLNPVTDIKEYLNSRSFYITDPNGLELEISEKFAGGH